MKEILIICGMLNLIVIIYYGIRFRIEKKRNKKV
jgi:hypothetical protein